MSSCAFSQNVGGYCHSPLAAGRTWRCLTPLGSAGGAGGRSFADHCKTVSAWVLSIVPAFPPAGPFAPGLPTTRRQLLFCLGRSGRGSWKRSPSRRSGRGAGRGHHPRVPGGGQEEVTISGFRESTGCFNMRDTWCEVVRAWSGATALALPLLLLCDRTGCCPCAHTPLLLP